MYFMASFFFFFAFGSYMLLQHHHNNNLKCQLMIRSGLQAAFYRKCLRLTPAARGDLTTGLIMTMCAFASRYVCH